MDDLIEGFIRLMDSPDDLTGPVNLGNPGEFTIKELAEKVIDMTGSASELTYAALPSDDPAQRRPDIGLARPARLGADRRPRRRPRRTIPYFEDLLKSQQKTAR